MNKLRVFKGDFNHDTNKVIVFTLVTLNHLNSLTRFRFVDSEKNKVIRVINK